MKGLINFYINYDPAHVADPKALIETVRTINQSVLDLLTADGYQTCFVPCVNESCRVERILFDT